MTSKSARPVRQPGDSTHVVWAIIALAAGGFGIGTTEFAIMGLLPETERAAEIQAGIAMPLNGRITLPGPRALVVRAPPRSRGSRGRVG